MRRMIMIQHMKEKKELDMSVGHTSWEEAVYSLKSFTCSKDLGSAVRFQISAASRGSLPVLSLRFPVGVDFQL